MEKSLDRFPDCAAKFLSRCLYGTEIRQETEPLDALCFLAAFMACPKPLKSYFSTSLPIVNSPYYILQFTFLSEYDCTSHSLDREYSILFMVCLLYLFA